MATLLLAKAIDQHHHLSEILWRTIGKEVMLIPTCHVTHDGHTQAPLNPWHFSYNYTRSALLWQCNDKTRSSKVSDGLHQAS